MLVCAILGAHSVTPRHGSYVDEVHEAKQFMESVRTQTSGMFRKAAAPRVSKVEVAAPAAVETPDLASIEASMLQRATEISQDVMEQEHNQRLSNKHRASLAVQKTESQQDK